MRSTSDDWATHEDTYCTFVTNSASVGVPVLYDTFSFRLALPPQSRRLEFCVCFHAEGHGQDYWDSNSGKNYVLLKKNSPYNTSSASVDDLTAKVRVRRSPCLSCCYFTSHSLRLGDGRLGFLRFHFRPSSFCLLCVIS